MQVDELKTLIKELHKQRHRGDARRRLQPHGRRRTSAARRSPSAASTISTYYMLTPEGYYFNFSGCGNTLNCNNPVVRQTGPRLPALLGRPNTTSTASVSISPRFSAAIRSACPLANPPLLETLAGDPILGQLQADRRSLGCRRPVPGRLFPRLRSLGRVERQVSRHASQVPQGRHGPGGDCRSRLQGSPDLYYGRGTAASVNFITCHDGFTLRDIWSRTTTSTTKPTASTTTTAPTTTTVGTAAGKAKRPIPASNRSACGR